MGKCCCVICCVFSTGVARVLFPNQWHFQNFIRLAAGILWHFLWSFRNFCVPLTRKRALMWQQLKAGNPFTLTKLLAQNTTNVIWTFIPNLNRAIKLHCILMPCQPGECLRIMCDFINGPTT